MEIIGAALEGDLDDGAVILSVFGGNGAGLNFDLFNSVDGGAEENLVDEGLSGDDAIHGDVLVGVALAVGAESGGGATEGETSRALYVLPHAGAVLNTWG